MAFYFIKTYIRRYSMKYEVPVCEMLEFCTEDVITTSGPDFGEADNGGVGDTVLIPTGGNIVTDYGMGGNASN